VGSFPNSCSPPSYSLWAEKALKLYNDHSSNNHNFPVLTVFITKKSIILYKQLWRQLTPSRPKAVQQVNQTLFSKHIYRLTCFLSSYRKMTFTTNGSVGHENGHQSQNRVVHEYISSERKIVRVTGKKHKKNTFHILLPLKILFFIPQDIRCIFKT